MPFSGRKAIPYEIKQRIVELARQGSTAKEISARFGVSTKTVKETAREAGVKCAVPNDRF